MSAPPARRVAAVDLGASGGRVMAGRAGPGVLELHEAHRFPNIPVSAGGTLHWDILRLYREVLDGLSAAARGGELASAGIDSWGVDYGLLDSGGALLGNPVHYRDGRTDGALDRVLARIPAAELYAVTGIQQMPINTICQLAAAAGTPQLEAAATLLMIPDLLGYWLTGSVGAEITNASTTGLLDVRAQAWAASADGPGRPAAGPVPAAAPAGRRHRRAAAGRGRRDGPARGARRGRGRLARHRLGRGRRPGAGPRTSPTSPAAPGRWSGWSWTSRC